MNPAPAIYDTALRPPREIQIHRLAIGARFEDVNGQLFVKEAVILNARRERRHRVRCLWSPMKRVLGPVSAAFFTEAGTVLYLNGGRVVFPLTPETESISMAMVRRTPEDVKAVNP